MKLRTDLTTLATGLAATLVTLVALLAADLETALDLEAALETALDATFLEATFLEATFLETGFFALEAVFFTDLDLLTGIYTIIIDLLFKSNTFSFFLFKYFIKFSNYLRIFIK